MGEYEKLKWICDKIGYEYTNWDENYSDIWAFVQELWEGNRILDCYENWIPMNPREIIFTPEFMEKYSEYKVVEVKIAYQDLYREVMFNLDNPVDYLYNLLDN